MPTPTLHFRHHGAAACGSLGAKQFAAEGEEVTCKCCLRSAFYRAAQTKTPTTAPLRWPSTQLAIARQIRSGFRRLRT
jgi:hypothetical protein